MQETGRTCISSGWTSTYQHAVLMMMMMADEVGARYMAEITGCTTGVEVSRERGDTRSLDSIAKIIEMLPYITLDCIRP